MAVAYTRMYQSIMFMKYNKQMCLKLSFSKNIEEIRWVFLIFVMYPGPRIMMQSSTKVKICILSYCLVFENIEKLKCYQNVSILRRKIQI